MTTKQELRIDPGEIGGWPFLRIDYPTDPKCIEALLPPGFDLGEETNVHLSIYKVAVPDEPEYGVLITVDAAYRGEQGRYAIGYGIDQESAIYISKERDGQPKYPCEIDYYRTGNTVRARCIHQGYTFIRFEGKVADGPAVEERNSDTEYWVKYSRAVGGAEKSYDFPPHAVRVHTTFEPVFSETLEGKLDLLESPWDPIAELLPMKGEAKARLSTERMTGREITLQGSLDPEAFWPYTDTIGSSRWPGLIGGPRREIAF